MHILPGQSGQITATLTKEVHAITHTAAQQTLAALTGDLDYISHVPSVTSATANQWVIAEYATPLVC